MIGLPIFLHTILDKLGCCQLIEQWIDHESATESGENAPAGARSAELLSAVGLLIFGFRQWMRMNLPTGEAMTVPRAVLLLALANKGDRIGMSELGEMNGLSPRSMTVLVDGLEREGLVERKAHPTDRRVTLVGITGEGRDMVRSALGPSQARSASLFDDLLPAEQAELLRLIGKLLAGLAVRDVHVPDGTRGQASDAATRSS